MAATRSRSLMSVVVSEASSHENQHDRTLRALVESKNWKQALAHVEKRLKKAKSHRLALNKALLQLRMSDARLYDQAIVLLNSSLQALSPVIENDVLHAVDETALRFPDFQQLQLITTGMWERTLKARPNDEGLLNELFERKLCSMEWDAARKLAMTRMRSQRDWYFRYILCLHLSARSRRSSLAESMKVMNAGIACKSLSKAATDVEPDPAFAKDPSVDPGIPGEAKIKSSNPLVKSIETTRELDLVIEVLTYHGKNSELLAILEDDTRTGIRSRIGNNFTTLKEKFRALRSCQEWTKLWNECYALLCSTFKDGAIVQNAPFAKLIDDWEIWRYFLEASLELHDSGSTFMHDALKLTLSACEKFHSQNAQLVLADQALLQKHEYNAIGYLAIDHIEKYYESNKSKSFLLRQLRNVRLLSFQHQARFLSFTRKCSLKASFNGRNSKFTRRMWIYTEINSLKFDYYLVISRTDATSMGILEAFITTCLRLFSLAVQWDINCTDDDDDSARNTEGATDRHVGDDAGILAAMAMIHQHFLGVGGSLVNAAWTLESVLEHSKHNYDAALLAIRVYIYMGQFARAIELFTRLDVKHIQDLSTLWIVICRISTLHPHVSKRMKADPQELLREACKWIRSIESSVRRAMTECLTQKSYRNLLRTIQTFESVANSPSTIMVFSELSGIAWQMTGQPCPELLKGFFDEPANSDLREGSAFPDYENPNWPSLEMELRPGPLPKVSWCKTKQRWLSLCHIWEAKSISTENNLFVSRLFAEYDHDPAASSATKQQFNDVTRDEADECRLLDLAFDLAKLACWAKANPKATLMIEMYTDIVSRLRQAYTRWTAKEELQSMLFEISTDHPLWYQAFNWSNIHCIYQRLRNIEIILATLRFIAIVEQNWKLDWLQNANNQAPEIEELESLARESFQTVKDWAKRSQDKLKGREFLESLITLTEYDVRSHAAVIDGANKLPNVPHVYAEKKAFVRSTLDGWIDTLEGLCSVQTNRF